MNRMEARPYHGLIKPTLLALALLLIFASSCLAGTVAYEKKKVAGVWVNLVTVDLNSPDIRITPAVAKGGVGTSESFNSMMRRMRPAAAINGTFFCTRSLEPTGDIVIDGHLLASGDIGTAVVIDDGNNVRFLPARRSDVYRWYDHQYVMAAGPSLLMRGETIVLPKDEGFCSSVHVSRQARTAIGLTKHNKLLLVVTRQRIYLRRLARVMKSLGCVDAAVLDGGSSSGLYWNGKMPVQPGRSLTNCLVVYDSPTNYEAHRTCFYPLSRMTKARGTDS